MCGLLLKWESVELHVRVTTERHRQHVTARAAGCGAWTHLYQQLSSATYACPFKPEMLEAAQTTSDLFFFFFLP